MSADLDRRLAATLHAHAGGETDPAPIVARARARGRHLKIRRRGLLGLGAAAVVAGFFLVPRDVPVPRPDTVMLPAAERPGAAERPDLVGGDPWTLHFSADRPVAGADHAEWKAGGGVESVEWWGPAGHARLVITRDRDRLDAIKQALSSSPEPGAEPEVRTVGVNARDAEVWAEPNTAGAALWFMRWQPVDGVWARLEMYGDTEHGYVEAAKTGSSLDFDAARRCAVPFRLTELPARSRVTSCAVTLGENGRTFSEGSLVVGDDEQRWMTIRAQRLPGRDDVAVETFVEGLGYGYTEQQAQAVRAGYHQNGDLDDITSWPH